MPGYPVWGLALIWLYSSGIRPRASKKRVRYWRMVSSSGLVSMLIFDGWMYSTHRCDIGGRHTLYTPVCGDHVDKVLDEGPDTEGDRAKEFGFVGGSGVLPEHVWVLD